VTGGEALGAARERKDLLYRRVKEARRAAAETADPAEKGRQTERARILRGMYEDACEECARLEGKVRKPRTGAVGADPEHIFSSGLVWSDLEGMTWGGLEAAGAAWDELRDARKPGAVTGRQYQLLVDLLNDGVRTCTRRQRLMLHEYYTCGKTMPQIAGEQGVTVSNVSRFVKTGLGRVGRYTAARLTIAACIDPSGRFDYLKFCRSTQVLTERETEVLYLTLTQDADYKRIAAYLRKSPSAPYLAMYRVERRLRALRMDFLPKLDVSGIKFCDWAGVDEEELARRLGLSKRFYYSILHRGERVEGMPPLHYHALCRLQGGWSPAETAAELRVTESYVRYIASIHQDHYGPLDPARLTSYEPNPVRRTVRKGTLLAALRDLTRGADGIIDRLDGATLARIREGCGC